MTESQPISVLIVDDSALMRRVMTDVIGTERDMEVVATAAGGQEAIRLATELQPDVTLMDIHMPDLDGIQATWLVANRAPHGAVVIVTSEERPDVKERALAAGAQAYVLKPFGDGSELVETVRRVYQGVASRRLDAGPGFSVPTESTPKAGYRIAVFGTKGGVGKTTIAVGLALALLKTPNTSVAVFDAHFLLGDTNLHLDVPTDRGIIDLLPYNEALNSDVLGQAIRRHPSGLDILGGPPRPEQAEIITPDHVRFVLGVLATLYDFVVVDTESSYDERMLSVLDLADVHVVVLTPHLGALRNARYFLDVANLLGYPPERTCFVLNYANNLAALTFNHITELLGTERVIPIPDAGPAVSVAINKGQPITLSQPNSPFARAIATLAEEVRAVGARAKSSMTAAE
jgi:pilus assembly protein CpaE